MKREILIICNMGFLPDDKRHKDIMIDSSLFGVEGTAQYLADAVRRKFGGEE